LVNLLFCHKLCHYLVKPFLVEKTEHIKCHSAKLLPIKPFLSSMTLMTLYCTDKVYRGEKNNEKCICVKFIHTCIGLVKNESVICHVSQLATAPDAVPTTPYNL
jgi:hypothetical protein